MYSGVSRLQGRAKAWLADAARGERCICPWRRIRPGMTDVVSGFRVSGLGFRVWGLGFGFRV